MRTKVLLVDDEEEFTEVLSERMRTRGLDVDTSNSGLDAIKKVKEKSYDAIILDLAMPEMDGIDTLKHLLDQNPDLQIIFLTGHATVAKGVEAVKRGAEDFIEKPIDIDLLLAKIEVAKNKTDHLSEKKTKKDIDDLLKKKGW